MQSSYDQEDYRGLIANVTRHPVKPLIGHAIFLGSTITAVVAKSLLKAEYAGIPLLLLLVVYPYYWVQLLMQWRMRKHQESAQSIGVNPTYVPSSTRGWAGVYIGVFFAITGLVLSLDKLLGKLTSSVALFPR